MKITIVGGGTAGWITAYFIEMSFPGLYDITVVESSKIGIIGAGEGSTGSLMALINGYFFDKKIVLEDFISKTDSTKKFGINHIGWSKNKQYFAPLDASPTAFELDDVYLKYIIYKNKNKNTCLASKTGIKYYNKIFNEAPALHFDGTKVGNYFKDICVQHNITVIDSEVLCCNIDGTSGFVKSITLKNNQKIESDLFIDCTGFSKKIISEVGSKWNDFSSYLPMNTAMPFVVENDKNKAIDPSTKAHALSSGWMWEIPLQTRKGMGYVFDKNFISESDAKKEVEGILGKQIDPIKIINFTSGYLDKFWNKNVIAFGLSSSFVEPLEATSIHNTIIQVSIFVKEFLRNDKKFLFLKENEKKYNEKIQKLNQLTIDFISIHYQGGREDSEFWKYIKNNKIISPGAEEYVNICRSRIPGYVNMEGIFGSYSYPLANWIGSGIELLNPKIAEKNLFDSKNILLIENEYERFYKKIINEKQYISYS
jgi:tryptophan halogenase